MNYYELNIIEELFRGYFYTIEQSYWYKCSPEILLDAIPAFVYLSEPRALGIAYALREILKRRQKMELC